MVVKKKDKNNDKNKNTNTNTFFQQKNLLSQYKNIIID